MNCDIKLTVKNTLLETLNVPSIDEINDESKLKDDLGMDSMSSLTFLMALEDSVEGFVIDPDTLESEDLETVATISNYVSKQMQ